MEQPITIQKIKEILPVQNKFLMLDGALKKSETEYLGWKSLTMNEHFFQGHFPNHPILPGVLEIEMASQLAEIAVQDKLDPSRTHDIYLKKLEQVKFRRPNVPGDRIMIRQNQLELTDTEAVFSSVLENASGVACQMKLTLAVRDRVMQTNIPEPFDEYDRNHALPKLDVVGIMNLIPHRYPFLFLDYVIKHEERKIVAVKNLSSDEIFYRTYPDGYMVIGNSIQSEIISQPGAIHILTTEAYKDKIVYFMGIEKAEFHEPLFPGDRLVLDVDIPPFMRSFGKSTGRLMVRGKIVSTISMLFAIVDP